MHAEREPRYDFQIAPCAMTRDLGDLLRSGDSCGLAFPISCDHADPLDTGSQSSMFGNLGNSGNPLGHPLLPSSPKSFDLRHSSPAITPLATPAILAISPAPLPCCFVSFVVQDLGLPLRPSRPLR
jgi:hypothetical protein